MPSICGPGCSALDLSVAHPDHPIRAVHSRFRDGSMATDWPGPSVKGDWRDAGLVKKRRRSATDGQLLVTFGPMTSAKQGAFVIRSGQLSDRHPETQSRVLETRNPIPDRRLARRLVTALGAFWSLWAVGVTTFVTGPSAVGVIAVVLGIAAGWTFYLTYFAIWEPVTGVSGQRLFFDPSFARARLKGRVMFGLLRIGWWRSTLRATGWPLALVTWLLLSLLALDLGLFVLLIPHQYSR
jgi:hypothetical protein